MNHQVAAFVSVLLMLGACSDDTSPIDTGFDSEVVFDTNGGEATLDAGLDAVDLALDAPIDAPIGLDGPAEAGADQGQDSSPADIGPDGPVGDMGTPSVYGTISRTATPLLDGKGNIQIGLYGLFPTPVAGAVIKNADLSQPGATVTYKIYNVPAGTFTLFAFLDDNNNAMPLFPAADAVDLVMSKPISLTLTAGSSMVQNIVLDKLQGASDAGMGPNGALKGKVTASAIPSGDGKGPLFISLHSQPPPAGQVAMAQINNADLSSPFASELYYIGNVPAGNYYLDAFLDDNGNANFLFPGSDKDDMILSKPIEVHIVGGTIIVHDIVLDLVKS
jgi:hypothetical protein